MREARSAARLRHRNVASVFHLGTEGETWFYAMEFIDGETLDALIKRQGPLEPAARAADHRSGGARAQCRAAARARASRHQARESHARARGRRAGGEGDRLRPRADHRAGGRGRGDDVAWAASSARRISPARSSSRRRRSMSASDIYSLGVTLWYMLAGRAPFAGSMAQVMSQQLSKPPPFEQFTNLPEPLAALLRRMLEKDPREPPADARGAAAGDRGVQPADRGQPGRGGKRGGRGGEFCDALRRCAASRGGERVGNGRDDRAALPHQPRAAARRSSGRSSAPTTASRSATCGCCGSSRSCSRSRRR